MKPVRFAAFLLYRYYSGGRRPDSSPYFRTLCTLSLLVLIHLMQLLVLINRVDILPLKLSYSKDSKLLIMLALLLPIYLLLSILIKKESLEAMNEAYAYSWDRVFNWNVWFIVYICLSFAFLVFLAWKSK